MPGFLKGLKPTIKPAMPRIKISVMILVVLVWVLSLLWIWWKGPEWTVWEHQPFAPVMSRALATAVWILVALGFVTWRVMKRLYWLEKVQNQQRQQEKIR
ncbi:type VI secretion protein IcmF [Salmonella enterica subsp. arizonae]|uniref:Type VI secretion protein IcmF n=1 Tax=Salmonella enterica subsp. arizonae TaxID=59203 RepID=A0A2X4TIK2_SALER|nr:type VI secretion protein IcmF [Salmonella enterica subsp. arizonae]